MNAPAWYADLHEPRTIAALTYRCPQCAATPGQHCRPYNRDRIVHEQRCPTTIHAEVDIVTRVRQLNASGQYPTVDEMVRLLAHVTRLQGIEKILSSCIAERAQFITAIENCPADNQADYWRWQGHAEVRRQLKEQVDQLGTGEST